MRFAIAVAFLALAAGGPALADTTVPPAARALFEKAEIAREEGRLEEAVKIYAEAVAVHPLYLEAHAGHLAALRGLGRTASALPLYTRLVAEHDDAIDLKALRAACLEPAAAVAELTKLAADYPGNLRCWLELSRAQLATGDRRGAEKTLKAALKRHSGDARLLTLMGDAQFVARRYKKARRLYEDARELDSAYVPALLRWALCRHREGKSEEAVKALGQLVAEDNLPRLVAGWWLLALVRGEMGKLDEAVKSMDRVLAIDKGDPQALLAKGQLLLQLGKPGEAAGVFAKAVEASPESSEALFCLGWAYEKAADAPEIQDAQRKERLSKAAGAYEKCAGLDPGVRPRDSLGFVYLLGERHADAVTQFRRASDIDPKFAPALNNLGLSMDIADNRAEAKKRYQSVLSKIDRNNVRAHVMLALDLWLDGSPSKAIKEFDKALKIDPEDDLAWTFLGDVYYDMKKVDRAIKAYKQAVEINESNFIAWYHLGIAYDMDKRKYEEAERCYEKAFQLRPDPPLDLLLRLGGINDTDILDRPEKALQYYQAYVEAGGEEQWVRERIEDLKAMLEGS